MSKKMMLLALAVASAALFALPAFASAEEIHWDTAATFTGTGAGGTLKAKGEPTITCGGTDVTNGTISAGGTTGTMTLDFTSCHTFIFGITAKCHTAGSPLDNTIASSGTSHLITWKNTSGTAFPAVLVTTVTTEIICAGISSTHVEGNVIGTITSPACGTSSKTMTLSFTSSVNASGDVTQTHELYTGKNYDLVARTGGGGGTPITAGLEGDATLTANTAGTLTCT
jgi:hypothetical protein